MFDIQNVNDKLSCKEILFLVNSISSEILIFITHADFR